MAECEVAAAPKAPVPPPPPPRASLVAAAAAASAAAATTATTSAVTTGISTMQLNGTATPSGDGTATAVATANTQLANGSSEITKHATNNNLNERATFFKNSKLSLENNKNGSSTENQTIMTNGGAALRDKCDNVSSTGATTDLIRTSGVCVNGVAPEDSAVENGRSQKTDRDGAGSSNAESDDQSASSRRLRLENERLQAEVTRLRNLLQQSGDVDTSEEADLEGNERLQALEHELRLAKEAVSELRIERKRLRSEKSELLSHVRQLCASLQDKEQELRDFIRNYEQRANSDRDRERWSLLRHARDEAERSLALAAQLSAREQQLQRAQDQLQEARRQLSGGGCMSDQESLASLPRGPVTPPASMLGGSSIGHGGGVGGCERGSCSADSGVRGSSDRESAAGNLSDGGRSECAGAASVCGGNAPSITVDPDSLSIVSSSCTPHMYQSVGTPKERSPTLSPLNAGAYSRSVDAASLSRSVEQLGSPLDADPPPVPMGARRSKTGVVGTLGGRTTRGAGGTWGSISRVFARSKHRSKMALQNDIDTNGPADTWSPLTEEGYAEKLRLLREASTMPIERWRAPMVLAWIEVALGMPQYGPRCAENIKSGKVLLELSDAELEAGLGTTHPMHRKKLRLAIEEQRRPDLCRYPAISQLGHTWVAAEWLPDLGLAQYAENFAASMVDARMLDTLSKKELEKFLGVTRKFHQASVVHGIHLLRIMKYDRQALAIRRHKCETMDADPLVWTNQRFIRWARAIDLVEYADNLKDSGVHGGLVVLEPSFNGDTMATALGIPPNKNIIRRHLATELEALVLPARAMLGQGLRYRAPVATYGSDRTLGQATSRSYTTGLDLTERRGSLRGSLSRAFKLRPRSDKMISPTPSSSSEGAYSVGPIFYAPPCPPGPPPSHRVSAPPPSISDSLQRSAFAQHRRVKSISDIEIAAAISSV